MENGTVLAADRLTVEGIRSSALEDLLAQAEDIRAAIRKQRGAARSAFPVGQSEETSRALRQEQRRVLSQIQKLLALSSTKMTPSASPKTDGPVFALGEQAEVLRHEIQTLGETGLRKLLFAAKCPDSTRCPRCGGSKLTRIVQRLTARCAACGKHMGLRRGTPLERTHVPITAWFLVCWAVVSLPSVTTTNLTQIVGIKRQATVRRMRRQLAQLCALSVRPPEHLSLRFFAQVLVGLRPAQEASSGYDG